MRKLEIILVMLLLGVVAVFAEDILNQTLENTNTTIEENITLE